MVTIESEFNQRLQKAFFLRDRTKAVLQNCYVAKEIGDFLFIIVSFFSIAYIVLMSISDMQNGDIFTFTHNVHYRYVISTIIIALFFISILLKRLHTESDGKNTITYADIILFSQKLNLIESKFSNAVRENNQEQMKLLVQRLINTKSSFEASVPDHLH